MHAGGELDIEILPFLCCTKFFSELSNKIRIGEHIFNGLTIQGGHEKHSLCLMGY